MTIRPDQIKDARKLLGWSRTELGKRVHVSAAAIGTIESGQNRSERSLLAIKQAFEAGGVEITLWGVRLRDDKARN